MRNKVFCTGPTRAAKAEQKSLAPAWQAQRTSQGRTRFDCTRWIPIHLCFNSQQGSPKDLIFFSLLFLVPWCKIVGKIDKEECECRSGNQLDISMRLKGTRNKIQLKIIKFSKIKKKSCLKIRPQPTGYVTPSTNRCLFMQILKIIFTELWSVFLYVQVCTKVKKTADIFRLLILLKHVFREFPHFTRSAEKNDFSLCQIRWISWSPFKLVRKRARFQTIR
jgi:hypothetical protein